MIKKEQAFLLFTAITLCMHISVRAGQDTLILDEWATVISIVGKAEIRSSDEGRWRPVHVGMRIRMDWDVRTQIESSLKLAFESGTIIKLSETSDVKLATLYNDTRNSHSRIDKNSDSGEDPHDVISVTDKLEE